MRRLQPCGACSRHVAEDTASCPFCGVALSPAPAARPITRRGLTRAALMTGAAVIARAPLLAAIGSVISCSDDDAPRIAVDVSTPLDAGTEFTRARVEVGEDASGGATAFDTITHEPVPSDDWGRGVRITEIDLPNAGPWWVHAALLDAAGAETIRRSRRIDVAASGVTIATLRLDPTCADASCEDAGTTTGEDGGPVALYGGPPDSGGTTDEDAGGSIPAYGGPTDSGAADSGGPAPAYGAPP